MDITNELPHNEEAEKNIVGILMQADKIGDVITDGRLTADAFYSTKLKAIYSVMLTMYDNGETIDFITLLNRINGMTEFDGKEVLYLKNINSAVVTTHNLQRYVDIVCECYKRRQYIMQAQKLSSAAYDAATPLTEIETSIDTMFDTAENKSEIHNVSAQMMSTFNRLVSENNQKSEIPGHKTGFKTLDTFTGGLLNGNMIVVAARPGMGKTIMSTNIAEFTAFHEDKPAIIFSLEMSEEEIINRIISSQTHVLYSHIQFHSLTSDDFALVGNFGNKINGKDLYINDESYMSISKIRSYARRIKRLHGEIGVIVIDYLQLITTDGNRRFVNRNDEISDISRKIKLLSKELKCPIVVLSQLNRGTEQRQEKRPQLSDLRDSGAIEQDADMVMFIHRESYYTKEENGDAEIIVAKNRHGKTGIVNLSWQPQIMKFIDWTEIKRIRKYKENGK